ncbi:MAG: DUF4373 domain-containing protein [Anaerofustis sp.]
MARSESSKTGIQYFPLDVNFNDNMNLFVAEKGLVGLGVIILLWKKIYSGRGYYTEWNDDIALLFAKSINLPADDNIHHYIDAALKRNIFSAEKYEQYGILTSEGIQERYIEATERRKEVKFISNYLLVNVAKDRNVCIIEENEYIFVKNAYKRKQTKQNETISNETILNEMKSDHHLLIEKFINDNNVDDEDEIIHLKIYDQYFSPDDPVEFTDLLKIYRRQKQQDRVDILTLALDITHNKTGVEKPLAYVNKVIENLISDRYTDGKTMDARRI